MTGPRAEIVTAPPFPGVGRLVARVLLFAAPSFAGLASRSASDDDTRRAPMEGFYAGIGGGGQLTILDAGNGFGYDVEARLGYSFNQDGTSLYVSLAVAFVVEAHNIHLDLPAMLTIIVAGLITTKGMGNVGNGCRMPQVQRSASGRWSARAMRA